MLPASDSRSPGQRTADQELPRLERRSLPEGQGAGVREEIAAFGCWTALSFSSPRCWKVLMATLAKTPAEGPQWDLRAIGQLDHIGAQLLWNHWQHRWPARLEMNAQQRAVLEQVAQYTVREPQDKQPTLWDYFMRFANRGPHMLETTRRIRKSYSSPCVSGGHASLPGRRGAFGKPAYATAVPVGRVAERSAHPNIHRLHCVLTTPPPASSPTPAARTPDRTPT